MLGFEAMDLVEEKYLNEALGKKYRQRPAIVNWWLRGGIAAAVAAAFVIIFAGVVNYFPVTAYAMSKIGFLGDLARAVTLDESMRVCLEKEYAQYVGEKKTTADGNASEVCCMVVDASRVSIFFQTEIPGRGKISHERDGQKVFDVNIQEEPGNIGYTSTIISTDAENLYEYRMDFMDKKIPEILNFRINYYEVGKDGDEKIASYSDYTLYPDMKYAKVVKTYEVNKSFYVEGQKITIESLEIYPTQAKLLLQSDKGNTARLNDISVLLYDDKGREYKQNRNGTVGTYGEDGNLDAKWYESSYFTDTDSITAVIDGVEMIPEEKRYGGISYKNKQIDNMPDGVSLKEMALEKEGRLKIELNVPEANGKWAYIMRWEYIGKEKPGDSDRDIVVSARAISSEGEKDGHVLSENETNGAITRKELTIGENPSFDELHYIPDYTEGDYRAEWLYAPMVKLDTPVTVRIK